MDAVLMFKPPVRAGAMEALFARLDAAVKARGYFTLGGQIVDASIVEAPSSA